MPAKAPTWRSRISTGTRTRGHVADYAFCEAAVQQTIETFGHLDIMVNNAAFQEHVNAIEELSGEQFDRTVKTNLYGYFHMTKAAVPHLKSGNAIVMAGSVTGIRGGKHLLDHSMTKGGIHAFARSLAAHLLDRGIRVNVIAPGPVWTPLNPADRPPEQVAKFGSQTQMRRAAQPRGGRARLRVHGGAKLLELHHGRDLADRRRIFGRVERRRLLSEFGISEYRGAAAGIDIGTGYRPLTFRDSRQRIDFEEPGPCGRLGDGATHCEQCREYRRSGRCLI
jgi:NAD(P)-dependent dehydrogenase (short-subunit alcohol dehydrogenase family)